MIARKSSRRIRRSRVRASRESSPVSRRVVARTARADQHAVDDDRDRDRDHQRDRRRDLVAVRLPEGLVRCRRSCRRAVFNAMTRAVFLDALGTLVELEPPWISLRSRVPAEIADERLSRPRFARRWPTTASTPTRAATRPRSPTCASAAPRWSRGSSGIEIGVDELVAAIRFSAYPDAVPALGGLRDRGLRLVAVSNWDCSPAPGSGGLRDRRPARRDGHLGRGRPRGSPTRRSSPLPWSSPGCRGDEALHVGDTPEEDVAGARAAGIRPLLIDRDGSGGDISSLEEIDQHL